MSYKLLAIDMDDTLLSEELTISKRTKKAVQRASKKGVQIVISTGRMYFAALPHVKSLELEGEMITYNGALISDINSGEIIEHRPVPLKYCQQIIRIAQEENLFFNLYIDNNVYINKLGFGSEYYENIIGIKPSEIKGDPADFLTQPSTKMMIIEENINKADRIQTKLDANFGEELNIVRSKPSLIEIIKKGVSKGATLAKFAKRLGVDADEVIAIGDSYNDVEMLEYAGLGVAMANAYDEIKRRADYVTASNNNNGVAKVIEEFIL